MATNQIKEEKEENERRRKVGENMDDYVSKLKGKKEEF